MDKKNTCINCNYYNYPNDECRRNPPTVMPDGDTFWPNTHDGDWCGEWSAREEDSD